MTKLTRRDDEGEPSDRPSSKKQRLLSVVEEESPDDSGASISEEEESSDDSNTSSSEEEESSDDSSSEEEDEVEVPLVVLSDDSDSEKDIVGSSRQRNVSPRSLTIPNSDVLNCPTCYGPLKRPIFQCNKGHVACSSCCIKLKNKCAICAMPIGDIRCRAMEKMIKSCLVSCSNAKNGCKQNTTYGKESGHEKLCVFAPCSCPLPDCNYVGFFKDIINHFHATHRHSPAKIMSFVFKSHAIFCLDHTEKMMCIFLEEKEGDVIVLQGFKGTHGVYVTMSHIAPMVPGVRKLSCSIAICNDHNTLRLGLLVKNIPKVREEVQPEDDFMLIPSYMVSDDHLKMQICISVEYDYYHRI